MKLFVWQPKGHGEQSIFVMAENLEQAKEAAEKKIAEIKASSSWGDMYFFGWGTDYYELIEVGPGEVILNDNN